MPHASRRFLLLQGPHGPFFAELGRALAAEGVAVLRAGVNAGDAAEALGMAYLPLREPPAELPARLDAAMATEGITDLLLYGEARPLHAEALRLARSRGIRTHILEEGYLRPGWITYERHGSNSNSPAVTWPIAAMASRTEAAETEAVPACPHASWGALRHHVLLGAAYHLRLLAGARGYPHYRPHRDLPLITEARRSLAAAAGLPLAMLWRQAAQRRALQQKPYYVLLMQLEHDSSLDACRGFRRHETVLEHTMAAFAAHAPAGTRLVVKLHPLESRRLHVAALAARVARRHGLAERLSVLPGGRLAPLLDGAAAAVTVTSTAGQQVLWRGLPLLAYGRTVYSHPELLPEADAASFMAAPRPPDPAAYARLRAFLIRTSQIAGCYYTTRGRRYAIAALVPRLLADEDAYVREAAVAAGIVHAALIPEVEPRKDSERKWG